MYIKLGLSLLMGLALAGCGGGSTVTTDIVKDSVQGIAELGRLGGADVKIFEMNGAVKTLKWTDTSSDDNLAGTIPLSEIGLFNSYSRLMDINKLYTIEISGGKDYDANDDGIKDAAATPNSGTLRMVTKGDWCYTCEGTPIRVTLVSELAFRALEAKINNGTLNEGDIENVAQDLLIKDLDGDGVIDTRDLLLYNPVKDSDDETLKDSVKDDKDDLITGIHNGDSDNDGIPDSDEKGADPINPIDTDNDGTPDYLDTDSDNDGVSDKDEVAHGTDPLNADSNRPASEQAAKDAIEGTLTRPITAEELNSLEDVANADPAKDYSEDLKKGEDPTPVDEDIPTDDTDDSNPKEQYADPANPTSAEIQAVIDARNAGVISLPSIGGLYNEIVTVYKTDAGNEVELIGEESYDIDGGIVANYKWIRACRGGVRGWQVVADTADSMNVDDTIPENATYCVYRLIVTDQETGRKDTNRNGFAERRVLRVIVAKETATRKRPVALATANGTNTTGWEDIGIGDTVELDGTGSYDRGTTPTPSADLIYTWYRAVSGQGGWKVIGEGAQLVDELPVVTRRTTVRYYLKVTDADGMVDNSLNRFVDGNSRSFMNYLMDPDNVINRKPIGILGFQNGARLTPAKVIRNGGNSQEVILDATRSRDREGVVKYTFEVSEDAGSNWNTIVGCIDTAVGTCAVTPSNSLPAFRNFWSRSLYRVNVKDADNNEDYSVNRVAYVRNGIVDSTPPRAILTLDGRGIKVIRKNGETQEITIDASRSTDNDEVVNYKIEKSNDGGTNWDLLSDSPTVTSVTDTPNADNADLNGWWSRTFYRVTVTDPVGLTHTSVVNHRGIAAYVRTVTPDTTKPVGRVQIEGTNRKEISNGGVSEEITLDAGTSTDNSEVIVTYTFMKSENNKGSYEVIEGCENLEDTTCTVTPSVTAHTVPVNQARTWYKVLVTDGEGLVNTGFVQAYADVVKPVTDTAKPTSKMLISATDPVKPATLGNLLFGAAIISSADVFMDGSSSFDAAANATGVVRYVFEKSIDSTNGANGSYTVLCDGAATSCTDTATDAHGTGWVWTYYKLTVYDGAGNQANTTHWSYSGVRLKK